MPQFYTVLTETGQAKMANAIALGTTIEIAAMAVGDGGGALPNPDSNRETLVNELRRAAINRVEVDADNPSWLIVEQVLPPDDGGWTIREVGIFDTDGDLIGYGNYPETYKPTLDQGSGRTLTIRMVLEVSHTAAVTLRVDPSVVLATREHVDSEIDKHAQSRNHPAATETAQGMLEIANDAEALEGEDDGRAMTPKKVHAAFNQYGLGGRVQLGASGSPDSLDDSRLFYVSAHDGGAFLDGDTTVSGVHVEDDSGGRAQQLIFRVEGDFQRYFASIRRRVSGAWGPQVGLLTTENAATALEAEQGQNVPQFMTPQRTHLAFNYFGLGEGKFKGTIDPDTLVNSGFYFINGDSSGLPISASGSITVTGQSARPGQVFHAVEENRIFTRSRYADNGSYYWTEWAEILNDEGMTGSVHAFAMTSAPPGFLKANGAEVSRTAYARLFDRIGTTFGAGNGSTTFNLPDLRGEFLRGWDNGRGVDSSRAIGSGQIGTLQYHTHALPTGTGPGGGGAWGIGDEAWQESVTGGASINDSPASSAKASTFYKSNGEATNTTWPTGDFGGETRPRNIALLFCIKY
jgi:phage-related tail fiber protein